MPTEKHAEKAPAPSTHRTLLEAIRDAGNPRWKEFYNRYQPLLLANAKRMHPTLDADELVNVAFQKLYETIPHFQYDPSNNKSFHNYLIGIVKNVGRREYGKRQRWQRFVNTVRHVWPGFSNPASEDATDLEVKRTVLEMAKSDYFNNPRTSDRTKEIARRLLAHEKPEVIAAAFGITRNNVDQINDRLKKHLQKIAKALLAEYEKGKPLPPSKGDRP